MKRTLMVLTIAQEISVNLCPPCAHRTPPIWVTLDGRTRSTKVMPICWEIKVAECLQVITVRYYPHIQGSYLMPNY